MRAYHRCVRTANEQVSFRCTVVSNIGSDSTYTRRLTKQLGKVLYRIGLVPIGTITNESRRHDSGRHVQSFVSVLRGENVPIAIEHALNSSVGTSYNRLHQRQSRRREGRTLP